MKLAACSLLVLGLALAGCGNTGIICSDTETRCGNTCANFQTSPDHCGACGNTCPTGFVCQNAQCVCPAPLSRCGQACVDTTSSVLNCGACGNACGAGEQCAFDGGSYGCGCAPTDTSCSGACVNVKQDAQNCGTCGNACDGGQVCDLGQCATSCGANRTLCGADCVDIATDIHNCGGCAGDGGVACAAGYSCTNGVCGCPAGQLDCGGTCVDPLNDRTHCGGCGSDGGSICGQGLGCVNGQCVSDLYAACYNSGEIFALDAQSEAARPDKQVNPPTNPSGMAMHGASQLEVVDSTANELYSFGVGAAFSHLTPDVATGAGPSQISVSGDTAAVVNATDGTLDIFTYASPGWSRRCAADAGTCQASVVFAAGSSPESSAFGPNAIYVTLQGDVTSGNNPDPNGNKVVRIALADLSKQTTDLSALDLQISPDAGTQARPYGVTYANGKVFVTLQNLPQFDWNVGALGPYGPGLVEVLADPNDGGALVTQGQPIALGSGCYNAEATLLAGNTLFVGCAPTYAGFSPDKPGALAGLDVTNLQPAFAPQSLGCPSGSSGCRDGAASRLALAAGKLFLGDLNDGRLFIADPQTGALSRGPTNPLVLCPAPDGGYNFISDVVSLP